MSNEAPDPMIDRAIAELRRLPPVDPAAIRRIANAAAEARLSSADEPVFVNGRQNRSIRIWSAAGFAAAAAIAGFFVRGQLVPKAANRAVAPLAVSAGADAPLRQVASSSAEVKPILQQFVFENAHASRVSVVGDFNKWNSSTAPMQRSSDGTTWSASIPIIPGRHIYGYMVDDSVFTLDPREPKFRDADLGTEGSVVIVGRP